MPEGSVDRGSRSSYAVTPTDQQPAISCTRIGYSEVGSTFRGLLLPSAYLFLVRTLFPPFMPDWKQKTGFPENDRTALLKRTKVLSPWRHLALAFSDCCERDDEVR